MRAKITKVGINYYVTYINDADEAIDTEVVSGFSNDAVVEAVERAKFWNCDNVVIEC